MNPKSLYILWTNADLITSEKMVCMYSRNALLHKWWDELTVILWGAPAKLAAENPMIAQKLEEMKMAGVKLTACKACADQLGVTEKLKSLGVEVKYWGEPLTELIQSGAKLITI